MAGGKDAGMGACGADGLELSLRLGSPTTAPAPAPPPARRNLTIVYDRRVMCAVDVVELQVGQHACRERDVPYVYIRHE